MKIKYCFVLVLGVLAIASCTDRNAVSPTGQDAAAATAKPHAGARGTRDRIYPQYTEEFLQPFRENFGGLPNGDSLLPAAHFRFVDKQTGRPLAGVSFEILRATDSTNAGNSTKTDREGFWHDEDFASDPGRGRYLVRLRSQTFRFFHSGKPSTMRGGKPVVRVFKIARGATPDWGRFAHVPAHVLAKAQAEWPGETLPAITVALSFDNQRLQEGWRFRLYQRDQSCAVPKTNTRSGDPRGYPELVTQGGFVFLGAPSLCGEGRYIFDNSQGGWFDYVCGPVMGGFEYSGAPIFYYVNLWCE